MVGVIVLSTAYSSHNYGVWLGSIFRHVIYSLKRID